ncbi:MAG: response regulator transcription factor [Pseudoflavonifractor sp.]|nr:response regulator transcription factor [Pseudoflavonifractor sp.]
MGDGKLKILVVDDEEIICELLQYNLELQGYHVDVCYDTKEALHRDLTTYSLFILDVMMGEVSGFKLAHLLKQNPDTSGIPVIFCTACDTEDDIVDGFNIGADDYVLKPFSIREMVARVRSVLRRHNLVTDLPPMRGKADISARKEEAPQPAKGLYHNTVANIITIDGQPLHLTRTEYDILAFFLKNRNRLFTRQEIFHHVWPEQVVVSERTIDVNISRIRKKLGPYAARLVNRSGFGYGFMDE